MKLEDFKEALASEKDAQIKEQQEVIDQQESCIKHQESIIQSLMLRCKSFSRGKLCDRCYVVARCRGLK